MKLYSVYAYVEIPVTARHADEAEHFAKALLESELGVERAAVLVVSAKESKPESLVASTVSQESVDE